MRSATRTGRSNARGSEQQPRPRSSISAHKSRGIGVAYLSGRFATAEAGRSARRPPHGRRNGRRPTSGHVQRQRSAQDRVDPRLPTGTGLAQPHQHIGIEPHVDLLFCHGGLGAAGTAADESVALEQSPKIGGVNLRGDVSGPTQAPTERQCPASLRAASRSNVGTARPDPSYSGPIGGAEESISSRTTVSCLRSGARTAL